MKYVEFHLEIRFFQFTFDYLLHIKETYIKSNKKMAPKLPELCFSIESSLNLKMNEDEFVTELCSVVRNGKLEKVLEILKNNNFNINTILDETHFERGNGTLLHLAIVNDQEEIVQFLVKQGADVNKPNKYGQSPFHLAVESGKQNWILDTLDGNEAKVALAEAIQNGHLKFANELISRGINPGQDFFQKCSFENSPLLVEAIKKNLDALAHFLLQNGVELEIKDHQGRSPLHIAILKDNLEIVQSLITKGANCLEIPFYLAKSTEVANLILQKGAKINAKDKNGLTKLQHAVMKGDEDFVKFLLLNGASTELHMSYDKNPLYMAVQKGFKAIVKMILQSGTNTEMYSVSPLLQMTVREGCSDILHLLLTHGPSPNQKELTSLLFINFYLWNEDAFKVLLYHGANINARDYTHHTLLHKAVSHSSIFKSEPIKFLLDEGASPKIRNFQEDTPLEYALRSKNLRAVKSLIMFQ